MNLHDWDTAFAIDLSLANVALARSRDRLIIDFDIQNPDGLRLAATGSFGDWQIVDGGSGQFVNLRLPIVSGTLTTAAPEPKTVDLGGTAFVTSIALDLIPEAGRAVQDLRFDISDAGAIGEPPRPGAVTPIRIDDPEHRLDEVQGALLLAALATYLAAHADRISFIFATVNLVPPTTDSWLAPVHSAFVYADRSAAAGGALVILSVTTDRDISGLARMVDPALLSSGYQAAFAFSRELFLEHILMPALPEVFGHGADPASFGFDSGSKQIVNTRPLRMDSVRAGLIDYSPTINRLTLGIDNDALMGRYEGGCDLKAGISMTFWVAPRNRIVYDAEKRALLFLEDSSAPSGHDADVPWWWFAGGPIVRLIVEIVVRVIASSLADSFSTRAGSMLSPARRPPTSIQWKDTADLVIGAAEIQGCFVMWGEFKGSS